MTVRITKSTVAELTVLQVAGRLQLADVSELEKEIRSLDGSFTLDLSELQSADEAGIKKLREVASHGAKLRDATRYVQLLLDGDGS